jgi:anaerobic selenocysteine-containing dehydrogenase
VSSQPSAFAALCEAVPFYAGLTDAEIGGRGIRWPERPAASALLEVGEDAGTPPSPGDWQGPNGDEADGIASAKAQSSDESAPSAPSQSGTFKLGTYRDLWVGAITELNPPLRFLAPQQRVELSVADAERLGVKIGDEVRVAQNGSSVNAKVDIKDRIADGAVFLIEGTEEDNANALLDGGPVEVSIERVGE